MASSKVVNVVTIGLAKPFVDNNNPWKSLFKSLPKGKSLSLSLLCSSELESSEFYLSILDSVVDSGISHMDLSLVGNFSPSGLSFCRENKKKGYIQTQ